MENRGLLVKIKNKSCIVLTPEGEYKESPLPKGGLIRLGQEVHLEKKKSLPRLRHFMVAASLLIIILAGQLFLAQSPPAAAYLTIDINPSIELAVSIDRKVLSVRSLNSDGERILSEVKIKGHELREAVELIVAQAITDQYLRGKEDNVILAALTVDNDAEPVIDLGSIYEAIKNPVELGGVDTEIIIEPVKCEMRQEATNYGISAGRYLLLQESSKKGVQVSVSEISTMSLGKLEEEKNVSFIDLLEEEGGSGDTKEKGAAAFKRGIYIERQNIKENTNNNLDSENVINGNKQHTGNNEKTKVPEHNGKR